MYRSVLPDDEQTMTLVMEKELIRTPTDSRWPNAVLRLLDKSTHSKYRTRSK